MQTWIRWAYRQTDSEGNTMYTCFVKEREQLRLYGLRQPTVQVELTEDSDGQYWGWLPTGDTAPTMVWGRKNLFEIQFPGGSKAEVARNAGTVVRMSIKEVPYEEQ